MQAIQYRGSDGMKNRRWKSLAAVLLLMLGMADAMAQQGQGGPQGGGDQPRGNERGGRAFVLPENSGFGSGGNVARGNPYEQPQQQQPNKMSPEDRRTLRRQINEAGHDIYAPRR
jgi:hypothetical protein